METRTAAIDEALASLKEQIGSVRGRKERKRRPWTFRRVITVVAIGVLATVLPFLLLIKIAVSLYLESGLNAWLSLAISAAVTTVLLTALLSLLSYRFIKRLATIRYTMRSVGVLVGVYCLYSVLFISGANVKSEEVAETYRSLHPVLRLSISTLVIVDDELVVTDAARQPEDYAAMGLPVNESSLHFKQSTGYVHAVDLRTLGRDEFRNALVVWYFRLVGFRTLRHTGTADHLHVSLPVA